MIDDEYYVDVYEENEQLQLENAKLRSKLNEALRQLEDRNRFIDSLYSDMQKNSSEILNILVK